MAAADALGALPGRRRRDELARGGPRRREPEGALDRRSRRSASGARSTQAPRVRERLDDTREDPEVRAFAARTLGAMCMHNATDRLTKLAYLARAPVDEADDRIGIAAIEALGALHPPDLETRLAPLRAKDVRMPVRRAAERALTEPGTCR